MYYRKKSEHLDKAHITRRKAVLKAVQSLHPHETFVWVGGVLHFASDLWPVKGAPKVPKPGKQAKGVEANEQPKLRVRQRRVPYTAPQPQTTSYGSLRRFW